MPLVCRTTWVIGTRFDQFINLMNGTRVEVTGMKRFPVEKRHRKGTKRSKAGTKGGGGFGGCLHTSEVDLDDTRGDVEDNFRLGTGY